MRPGALTNYGPAARRPALFIVTDTCCAGATLSAFPQVDGRDTRRAGSTPPAWPTAGAIGVARRLGRAFSDDPTQVPISGLRCVVASLDATYAAGGQNAEQVEGRRRPQ